MSIKAINIAKKLAKKYELAPGFDIQDLIRSMGIALEITPLESMSGFAYQKQGKKVIGIDENEGSQRQRFTMAHELGHMLVHARDDVTFDRNFVYFRDGHSSTGLNPKEREANAFAAELLMPADRIARQVAAAGGIDLIEDEDKIRKLAEEYNVSFSAMSVRLDSLARHGADA